MVNMQFDDPDSTIDPLPEDNDPPFREPDATMADPNDQTMDRQIENQELDPTHQATDSASNIDEHEVYDTGLAGAAEATEPNAGNAVTDYDPANDQRNSDGDQEAIDGQAL